MDLVPSTGGEKFNRGRRRTSGAAVCHSAHFVQAAHYLRVWVVERIGPVSQPNLQPVQHDGGALGGARYFDL